MTAPAQTPPALTRPDLASVLEYMHPITWFAPMWAFGCGIVSSGASLSANWQTVAAGVLLAGPMVCGTSQAVNDWYDRHVDAINEPNRPIPSGRIPGAWGFYIAVIWTVLSFLLATVLGVWGFGAAAFGLALAWAYSAPPFRLKGNGWLGNLACGVCYEGVPWFTAAAIVTGGLPDWRIVLFATLYSLGAHGIMTLNDFKSVEGDIKTGVRSLPVQLGVANAARLACAVMALPQIIVIGCLLAWDRPFYADGIGFLLAIQFFLMNRLLKNPRGEAIFYNATGTTLYVLGMLVSAFALRPIIQGVM
jgi:chlorophyll/bacteriochlorophyll a synthase